MNRACVNVCRVKRGFQGRVRRWRGRRCRPAHVYVCSKYFAASKHGGMKLAKLKARLWSVRKAQEANA